MCELGTDKPTCPERNYQKDLEVCNKATEGPWIVEQMTSKKARRGGGYIYYKVMQAANAICHYLTKKDANFIALARTALPWYIKRCMALESQLQQAEERGARYREALQYIQDQILGDFYECDLNPLHEAIISTTRETLSSPAQPSRYREMEVVVKAAREACDSINTYNFDRDEEIAIEKLKTALADYDKTGEGAGE